MPQEAKQMPHPMSAAYRTTSASRPCCTSPASRPNRLALLALTGALAVLALLIAASPAAALSSQYSFTISGHGWGHGIGMSQWGAYGYAKHGWAYKAILRHYYTGISFSQAENPLIRVNLRSGLTAVELSCPKEYTVRGTGKTWTIPAGTVATTTWTGAGYHVVAGALDRVFTGAPIFTPTSGSLCLITKTDLGDDGAYRGTVRVRHADAGLMMVNSVPLESYLRGVLPHEVSPSWPRAALKAQACAARAYGLRSRQSGKAWDVYCDVRDQAYAGVDIEDPRTDAAVRDTAGVTPTYNGEPILATYFSCSGGHTENIELAWAGSSPVPYLKGVEDPYDSYGTLHDWGPVRRTSSAIGKALGVSGFVRAVYRVERGTSPRIVKAAVIASGGTTFVDGGSLRMKLGLNSAWATFKSMGIKPAARDKIIISAGSSITLRGRIYPALREGTSVTLHAYYDGRWHSWSVGTTRKTEELPGDYTARYSVYSKTVSPTATTKYYFSSGTAKSPTTTITVN